MNRRSFLGTAAALCSSVFLPRRLAAAEQAIRPRSRPKISEVEIVRVRGKRQVETGINRQYQVQPLHIYPEHRPRPYQDRPEPGKGTESIERSYVRIRTDAGLEGLYGAIDEEAVRVVLGQLRSFLLGKDALAVEALWDKMYRLNRHSRAGHYMMGISAVDNALWDLRGRFFNVPVYQLLGGSRNEVEAYGSCLGYSVEQEPAAQRARQLRDEGFRYQKWFLAYGPGDGPEGIKKNIGLIKALRGTVGDQVEIACDAFNGWDLQYAVAWAKAVEQYHPYWIEEPFISDQMEQFAQLSRATSIPVATGEHFYGRWEVGRFLKAEAIQVVQADPEWCGGTSELVKICALASVHGVRVIPHGHGLRAAMHVVASQSPLVCPLVEYLLLHKPSKLYFEKDAPAPVEGKIKLPDRPGFGIEFDGEKVQDMVVINRL